MVANVVMICCRAIRFAATLALSVGTAIGDDAPDPEGVALAGRTTIERMEREQCSWTMVQQVNEQVSVKVRCLHAPEMWRMEFYAVSGIRREHSLGIISRDGLWYVMEGGNRSVYRPYEAPVATPSLYVFLHRTFPIIIDDADAALLEKFKSQQGHITTYDVGLPAAAKAQLESGISGLEALMAKANRAERPDDFARSEALIEQLRRQLKAGAQLKVDTQTGIVVNQAGTRPSSIEDFQFRDDIDPMLFDVEGDDWEDHTADICTADRNRLAIFRHAAAWRPGLPVPDLGLRIVNLDTREFRRVPYHFGIAESGCLSADKTKVYVTGHVATEGVIRPFEIDLATGEHRALGENILKQGQSIQIRISPDGNKLAVAHITAEGGPIKPQTVVIDIESGRATALHEPMDSAFHSWLPDSNGLIFIKREYQADDELGANPAIFLCHLSLDGTITKLRKGNEPQVLAPHGRILFRDEDDGRNWKTCDLKGQDVRPLGGQYKRFSFPSLAPKGRELLWMTHVANYPVPHILDLKTRELRKVELPRGMWAWPKW